MTIFISHVLGFFFFLTLPQSNHLTTTVTFSEQLFLQSIFFYRGAHFQNSHFFAAVIWSEQLLFLGKTFTEESSLENRKFFEFVTFWNSSLFGRGIAQDKDIYRRGTFWKQILLYSISAFSTFWSHLLKKSIMENFIPCAVRATFWKKLVFRKAIFRITRIFWRATFSSGDFFKRRTFSQYTFSEKLLIHSQASFPQMHFLFSSQ